MTLLALSLIAILLFFSTPIMAVPSGLVAALAGAVFAYALYSFLGSKRDPREPPYITSAIPLIGHLLGMAYQGADYFRILDEQYHQPIYTLPMLM